MKTIDLIAVFDAILTARQSGQNLQCLYGNLVGQETFPKSSFPNLSIKILTY